MVFEVVGSESEESFENVEASEDWLNVGVLEEFPDIDLEVGPGIVFDRY